MFHVKHTKKQEKPPKTDGFDGFIKFFEAKSIKFHSVYSFRALQDFQ